MLGKGKKRDRSWVNQEATSKGEMAVVVVTLKVKGTGDCIEMPLSVHAWGCEKLSGHVLI